MAFKVNKISERLEDYSICLGGESGIGKTTLMVETCEREFGEDGYVIFNAGKEQGIDCIDGAVYEDIEDYKKLDSVIKDIVANKETEYPNLKVVVFDTLDQIIEICEPEVIRKWNADNMGAKDFKPARTLNAACGGFGRGEDEVIKLILGKIWELKRVGVRVWYTMHVKTKEIVDPLTNTTYTMLAPNMMQKYFNGIKTKMHLVGIACVDRTIEEESTGRKNIVTRKDITVNRIRDERRKIVFRDDNYSVDGKSRFRNIVSEIPMDTDAFITALKDAIKASKRPRSGVKKKQQAPAPPASKPEPIRNPEPVRNTEPTKEPEPEREPESELPFPEAEYSPDLSELRTSVLLEYKKLTDKQKKKEINEVIKEYGKYSDVDEEGLRRIERMLNED